MKHMVRNDRLLEKIGFDSSKPHPIIYSCEFDDGSMAQNVTPLRLGADGMEIWFFPCFSCSQQLRDYVMEPLFLSATKEAIKEKRQQEARTIVYRSVALIPLPDYEVPASNSPEWKAVEQEIDKYLDEGKPMRLVGFDVFFKERM